MKISIIIPVYNGEKHLHQTIQSIQQQTFNDYEVIFINDGSTDSSLDILNEYSQNDQRYQVVSVKNGGELGLEILV